MVGILRNDGLLNKLLMSLGLISSPLEIYRTDLAVYIGLVYAYLPFFHPAAVRQPGEDGPALCSKPPTTWGAAVAGVLAHHRAIVAAGVIAGAMLVFIPSVGEYVIPEMLGGADTLMMGRAMWNEFFKQHRLADGLGRHLRDGAVAAGAAGPVPVGQPDQAAGFRRRRPPMKGPNKSLRMLVLGPRVLLFLYVPIISLMVFSFNDSPVVTS